ncbi:MAG: deoxyribose-phosphate aldolase [Saprospiraceae bacterium]|nr:deoxyribose-phosphate aldolase [Saprospiraceae bacterium]
MKAIELSQYIDHTILKPDITSDQIKKICNEALQYGFASVCVQPYYVPLAFDMLKDQEKVKVCTVVDFPFGYSSTFSKVESIKKAIDFGAEEIDSVINILAIKNEDWKAVKYDLEAMKYITLINKKLIKIIFETCYLSSYEIEKLSQLCVDFEIDFLKTSTGYGTAGATVENIRLMKKIAGNKAKIKASGGIKTLEQTLAMIEAGADRIGTSSGVNIIKEFEIK